MDYRITCAAMALAGVLAACPLWAGPGSGSASVASIAEEIESFVDPFAAGTYGEGDQPSISVAGRLLLPWGRNDDGHQVVLSLKNDSKQGPRVLKAIFFNPAGKVVAVSKKLPLAPRASAAFPVNEIIAEGEWLLGSIEILYTGPGKGRVFGSSTQVDFGPMGQTETQALVQAGFHVSTEPDDDGGR